MSNGVQGPPGPPSPAGPPGIPGVWPFRKGLFDRLGREI
jgi:hypothetical protein